MRKKNLYFGRLTPGGSANILVEMLGRDRNRRFVSPCPMAFSRDATLEWPYHYMVHRYVRDIVEKYQTSFRLMDWGQNISYLQQLAVKHDPRYLWVATYNNSIFQNVIKNTSCLSISVNYDRSQFDLMRRKWARWLTGTIMQEPEQGEIHGVGCQHRNLRDKFSTAVQIETYILESDFDKKLDYSLPDELYSRADIEIDFKDLFDQQKFQLVLDRLGCQIDDDDWYFYQRYLECSG